MELRTDFNRVFYFYPKLSPFFPSQTPSFLQKKCAIFLDGLAALMAGKW